MVRRRQQGGFTVVELMIVVMVAGILAMIAVPSFSNLMANNRVRAAASDLHLALLKARGEAVRRNATIRVAANAGGWANGWRVLDGGNNVLSQAPAPAGTTITVAPAGLTTVTYLSSGRIVCTTCNPNLRQPGFSVTSATVTTAISRCVYASLSGMPAVREGTC
jgi:type IV fimbrial biogenesis protein FimT